MARCDAVILAGGRASEEMARRTGTPLRALFPWRGKSFAEWNCDALRASEHVGRIAIIGPPELAGAPGLSPDLLLTERENISANLLAAVEALQPRERVLITACDNPLLTTAAFDDFLSRAPEEAAVAYPILAHSAFLDRFPGATNIPVALRDGVWIGGGCALIAAETFPRVRQTILDVLAARKSKLRLLGLLGWGFALRFALRRLRVADVERRAEEILGLPFRFVSECSPAFAIDIDDPEDWDYLSAWAQNGAERASKP